MGATRTRFNVPMGGAEPVRRRTLEVMVDDSRPISAALEAVLNRFGATVRRIGWRHGLSGDEVDEVIQEMRIRLWRARGTEEDIARAPASYVHRAALTAALGVLRRRRSHAPLDENTAASPVSSSSRAELSELAREVERALTTLSDDRQAAVRAHLSGYSRSEIAQLMGWSDIKTKNLLARGLADLRQALTSLKRTAVSS
jgi:RNA polymerase sigma factor (sigma-70 family)